MNPGMWPEPLPLFHPGLYPALMRVAGVADRLVPTQAGPPLAEGWRREIAACVQCGYCVRSCPTRQLWLSSTPRGRILMTKDLYTDGGGPEASADYKRSVLQCSMCGRCRIDCSVDINSPEMWRALRGELARQGWGVESFTALAKTLNETHNLTAKANDKRLDFAKRVKLSFDLAGKRQAEVIYFVGCVTAFYPMIQPAGRAFLQILNAAGVDFATVGGEEWCCGFPLFAVGKHADARELVRHNLECFKDAGAKTIVMNCPGCYRVWKEWYRDVIDVKHTFQVFHAAEYLAELIGKGKLPLQSWEAAITWHDPCDLGRNSGIFDEPRYVIGKIPGLELRELENNRQYCSCCGSGGGLLGFDQELSLRIAACKLGEVLQTGTRTVATGCPACIRALNMAKMEAKENVEVLDLTQLVAKAMGGQPSLRHARGTPPGEGANRSSSYAGR